MSKTITVLDLFSGCGGLTEGFFNKDYSFVGHVEMDSWACESLKTRIVYHFLKKENKMEEYNNFLRQKVTREEIIKKYKLQDEIEKIYNSEISNETNTILIQKIKQNLDGKKLHILIGGPPCQTYSHIGRSRLGKSIEKDSRNFLYQHYAKFLEELQPEVFVFENVPGLKTAGGGKFFQDMKERFSEAGYYMETDIQKITQYMPDYGIIQNRKRLIIIGWKINSKIISEYPNFIQYQQKHTYKVNDFLKDLPIIESGGGVSIMKYRTENPLLKQLEIRDESTKFVENHITRPIRDQDKKIYAIAVDKYNQGTNLIYSDLPQELITHKNTKNFQNRFCVVKGNHTITNTVVAHISKDGHYYIHPDKKQNRSLSIREAARIQTFPDNFKFEGGRTAAFKQIGNAVPPMFSKIIAKELKKYFLGKT